MEPSPTHVAALAYAKRGWRVLPLDGKVPFTQHGVYDATTDPAVIDGWFRRYPFASVGIACGPQSDLWVLDADHEEGLATLKTLGIDKRAPYVWTGGGGVHVFFAWSDAVGQRVRCLPGIDTRADRGYVVAPPSIHKSGVRYKWGGTGSMPTGILDQAHESLLALVRKPDGPTPVKAEPRPLPASGLTPYGKVVLDRVYHEIACTTAGSRDDRRNTAAFSLGRLAAGGHVSKEDVIACITAGCERNGLLADMGEKKLRLAVERAIEDGYAEGPRGPVAA